jgi:NitT/TauT family transport system substrate-binding protein
MRRAALPSHPVARGRIRCSSGARRRWLPKPEAGTFKPGIEPWLGYGQWHIAAKKGLFAKEGLSDVQIVNFTEDKDINAALASGQLDAANIATHTAMGMVAAGLPVKIVTLLDFSLNADAILAGKDIQSIADIKGKEVAFEQGTTSDILLNYALANNGMTIADVKPVPMPAADRRGKRADRRTRSGRRHL